MMPWEDIDKLSRLGFVGGLIIFVILLYKGKLRWGREFEAQEREKLEIKSERDRWMRAALKGTEVARHAVRVVDKASANKADSDDEAGTDS